MALTHLNNYEVRSLIISQHCDFGVNRQKLYKTFLLSAYKMGGIKGNALR